MYKTARNLAVLGTGLSISALVGWFLLRESRRDSVAGTVLIKSSSRAYNSSEVPNIVLPPEALNTHETTPPGSFQPPVVSGKDDLTQINDIGPRFADALNTIGITTYGQLAEQNAEVLADRLSEYVSIRPERIQAKNWIGQAVQLAKG